MKLYYSKGACSLAVRILINELGLTCTYESVDLKTKKTAQGEDYLKINPKGAVPVLEIKNNEVLTENATIQQYLAEKYHALQLLPAENEFKRYRVLEWLNFITTDLHKGFGPLFNPKFSEEIRNTVVIPTLKAKFAYIDKHLENHRYLSGNEYSLPDGYLFVMIMWAARGGQFDLPNFPYLSRYFEELKKRPSIQKSLAEEGISL